jgi:serine/threonine-protein kinase RsbW
MEMTFKRSLDELQAIVAATDRFFSGRRIDPALRLPVDLSIEELFVNLVKYNRGTTRDITLRLDWVGVGDAVEVSLTDHDVDPFDPTRAPELDVAVPLAARRPNGMGLYLVSKMVDAIHYEYRNRESKVTFTKRMAQGHA